MEEQVEVIDDNFNILRIASREEVRDKNLNHKAVGIIIKNSKNQFYAAQRSAKKKVYPLRWELGGGGAVDYGESFEEAAKREIKEELGFDSEPEYLFDFDYSDEYMTFKAKIYLVNHDGEIIVNKEDFEQGKWISVEKVEEMIKNKLLCPDAISFVRKYLDEFFNP